MAASSTALSATQPASVIRDTGSAALIYLRVSTSRQARKGGESEGYSIPAQREACVAKAHEMGITNIEEFVDAGASARNADRSGLQEMLRRLQAGVQGEALPVKYVIVHKVDRLARDRFDDVSIQMAIVEAGARLVSVSENIDESPSGMLVHGIMSTISEFYSKNLSNEAKKGIEQKIKNGGTHGQAPIGYTNTLEKINGVDVKGVAFDNERAPHIAWAFEEYAAGELSVSDIAKELATRGLVSRTTRVHAGKPLSRSQVHRMLSNPYYIGKIVHKGVVFDGAHEPLVSEEIWHTVQDVLSSRRLAGDRSWKHNHYLKGTFKCKICGSVLSFGYSRGKTNTYSYFFCLGRHTGRTRDKCNLPYILSSELEQAMLNYWSTWVSFSPDFIEELRPKIHASLRELEASNIKLQKEQKKRLAQLERKKEKLVEAYLNDALPVEDLRVLQDKVAKEMHGVELLLQNADQGTKQVKERLDTILNLMKNAGQLYEACSDKDRQRLNQCLFEVVYVLAGEDNKDATSITINADLSPPAAATKAALAKARDKVVKSKKSVQKGNKERNSNNEADFLFTGCSNLTQLAEDEGFEPSIRL